MTGMPGMPGVYAGKYCKIALPTPDIPVIPVTPVIRVSEHGISALFAVENGFLSGKIQYIVYTGSES